MNFSLIFELAKRDFTERYSGSALGFMWSFIYPLINIVIYIIIFGNLMGARLPGDTSIWGYGVYLISGLVPWTAFTNTVTRASTVFLDKKNIIAKIHVDLPHTTTVYCDIGKCHLCDYSFYLLCDPSYYASSPDVVYCVYPAPLHYSAGFSLRTWIFSCNVCGLFARSQGSCHDWFHGLVLVHTYRICF